MLAILSCRDFSAFHFPLSPSPMPRTVLITGCSSGIGQATARLLVEEGFHVLAGVRSEEQAAALIDQRLPRLEPVQLDVTCDGQIGRVLALLDERHGVDGLYALVNNAGLGLPSALELATLEEVGRVIEVNTIGPLRMIQRCLPHLRRGAAGRVINMSSVNGSLALPTVGAYSASKFALEAISDTLRVELRPWGIPVSLIQPGQINTAIFAKGRAALAERIGQIPEQLQAGYGPLYARASRFNERGARSSSSPEKVANVVLRVLRARRPKARYKVGLDAYGLALLHTLLPQRLLDRVLARAAGVLKACREMRES
jgi:NAD(P)-dependent dehydrogenase (short-subunit alcohol dehydrogenase family)